MIPWNTVHEFGQLLEDGELEEIEYENSKYRVKLSKKTPTQPAQVKPEDTTESHENESPETKSPEDEWVTIESPMVGTFYKAPAPDADPFVEVGDTVSPETTVCIIEAMKLMNEIESDVEGTIQQVCRENAEPVSKGDDLFYIEPST